MNNVEKDWVTKAGLRAVVLKHPRMGHHCGYVAVPHGHELFGKDYADADVEVHGGLTYAGGGKGVYPVPSENLWWFGYDCAHGGDMAPGISFYLGYTYKDLPFCECECESLAEQLTREVQL